MHVFAKIACHKVKQIIFMLCHGCQSGCKVDIYLLSAYLAAIVRGVHNL